MHQYHRSKPQGRAHRARLRALVVPRLTVGAAVPTGPDLSRLLRIHLSEAYRHMRRVLAEEGIATETRGRGRARRVYVTDIPAMRAAA